MTRLRAGNLVLAALHSAQAILIVVIGATLTIPITASWAQGPLGTAPAPPSTLFDLSVRWCVAAFLLMAALDHLLVALPEPYRGTSATLPGASATRAGSSTRSAPP